LIINPLPSNGPTVLVLASGRGERFAASGGTVHKLLAQLGDKTVLQQTLEAVRASGLPWHVEDLGHPGMGGSIAAAVAATTGSAGWLVLPADLPLVLPDSLRAVAQALQSGHRVVVPTHLGVRGHPVGFAASLRSALLGLSGQAGASPIVASLAAIGGVAFVELDDVGIVTDIDTLDDLAAAQRLWAARE
jgi:molybdenum cofactor cytidylyltransferase